MRTPTIEVRQGNIFEIPADVMVLKYAQAHYGADRSAAFKLVDAGEDPTRLTPRSGDSSLVPSRGVFAPKQVLFLGVTTLFDFGYQEIRTFARDALSVLSKRAPSIKHVTTTLHGPGYGLDENEAFEAEVAGFLDACESGSVPKELERISIVELNSGRCHRLGRIFQDLIPNNKDRFFDDFDIKTARAERLRVAGYSSKAKPHVFVAIPFKQEMDDIYHYGIHNPIREAGYVCERADTASFTGDIMQWVFQKISSATLVVAELSEANPNVYLEVGYAWGCKISTILLAQNSKQLQFDVQGHKCLVYKRIKDLEERLRTELSTLKQGTAIAE